MMITIILALDNEKENYLFFNNKLPPFIKSIFFVKTHVIKQVPESESLTCLVLRGRI